MDDLISRQAAKDMLWNERQRLNAFMNECAESNRLEMRYFTKIERNQVEADIDILDRVPSAQSEIIRCKDCKHFEYNHIENVNGIPLIVAHEICMRWCDGTKTSENGYCFLAERKDNG